MNTIILTGRPTKDPEVRYGQGENPTAVAHFTLAVDRRIKKEGDQTADFINCTAFGKQAEVIEKYFRQGSKMNMRGHVQTGSYTNKKGDKVYTFDAIVDEMEFGESKAASEGRQNAPAAAPATATAPTTAPADDFAAFEAIDDELPFN